MFKNGDCEWKMLLQRTRNRLVRQALVADASNAATPSSKERNKARQKYRRHPVGKYIRVAT
jgi:hypothetical protein